MKSFPKMRFFFNPSTKYRKEITGLWDILNNNLFYR